MSQERTEGVVLRAVDFGDTSRIVTFLTPDRGRLACLAAGMKRPKSELAGQLDTFNRVELVYYWKDSRSVQKLGTVSLLDNAAGIKADLDKSVYGAVPLEVAYKVAHENEPSEELYRRLAAGLVSLAGWRGSVVTHCCWQVMRLLQAAGFEPNLDDGPASRTVSFTYESGVTASAGDVRLNNADLTALRELAASKTCPVREVSGKVFSVLTRYASHQLEASFRSVRVVQEMYAT